MKVLKEEKNPLLSRTSLILEEDHAAKKTPSYEDVAKKIADILKTKPELVKVKHIYSEFGKGKSRIIANVYTSLEKLKDIEEIKKKVKKEEAKKEAPKEKAEKEETKKEQPKVEEKKEEVKEDAKEAKAKEQKAK